MQLRENHLSESSLPASRNDLPSQGESRQSDAPLPGEAGQADARTYRPAPFWMALVAAVFTLPLLYVGGTVTTYRVGLAVPDWPQTFGTNMFLYNFWNEPFGVRVEHTHRLYGAAVGLATIILCLWFLAFEPRRWLKGLGVLALVAVIIQGILGGTRVTQISTLLAAIHGVTGQAFFGLVVALCVFTSRKWHRTAQTLDEPGHLRGLVATLLGAVAIQIGLGSSFRHFGAVSTIIAHGALAAAIWIMALIALVTVERNRPELSPLSASARMLAILLTLQLVLGAGSLYGLLPLDGNPRPAGFYAAVVRTSHQTGGALILAAALVLSLRTFRQLGPWSWGQTTRRFDEAETRRRPAPAGLDWEVVA